MITYVALPFQIFAMTHSSLAVGVLGVVEFVPMLFMSFLGGALADSVDRRKMVLITETLLMVLIMVLAVNARLPHPQLWVLYVVAGTVMGVDSLQRPSLDALVPRLVPREETTSAAALLGLRGSLGMIVGPAIGGILISAIGLSATYLVDVATFAASLVLLSMMKAVPPPPDAKGPSFKRIAEGIRFARSRQELVGTYVVDIVAMFFGMPIALFPALAQQYGGADVLGILLSAPAVGSLVATATSGWTSSIHRHGLAVTWAACAWGAAITCFGLSTWLPLALFFLALAGAADMISGIFRMTIWNQTIPDELRGRLAGIELLSYASGPALSGIESGAVASAFTPRVSVVSGGLLCIAGAVVCAALFPGFRTYSSKQGAEPPPGTVL